MAFGFRRKIAGVDAAYAALLAQSRAAAFYGPGRAPDTVEGRLEVLMAHLALVLRRLRAPQGERADFAQALLDAFFRDVDSALREIGVGDLTVAKKMKKIAEGFYGRAKAYDEGLEAAASAAAEPLEDAVRRNLCAHAAPDDAFVAAAADYLRASEAALSAQSDQALLAGAPPAFAAISAELT